MPPEPAPAAANTTSTAAMSTSHFNGEPRRLRLRAMADITIKATPLAHEPRGFHEPNRPCYQISSMLRWGAERAEQASEIRLRACPGVVSAHRSVRRPGCSAPVGPPGEGAQR